MELLVVGAIVSLLAAIAIPAYYSFQLRSKKAESKALFAALRNAQIAFKASFDGFADITAPNPAVVPGMTAVDWSSPPCPAACSRVNVAACTRFPCIGFSVLGSVRFSLVSPRRLGAGPIQEEFAIGMAADLDGVAAQSSFSFQSGMTAGQILSSFADGISSCPVGIPVETLVDCAPYDY